MREKTLVFLNPLLHISEIMMKDKVPRKGKKVPRTNEIKEFQIIRTLKKFGN